MTPTTAPTVKPATVANFHQLVLTGRTPVVVDFWAPWCVWCKKLAPIYAEVSGQMKDEMTFVTVNVDEERDLAEKYGISSLPTLKFFCDGREIGEMVGALAPDQLRAKFREVIGMQKACLTTSTPLTKSEARVPPA